MTFRTDLGLFTTTPVAAFRKAIGNPALLDGYELTVNAVGNLAVSEWVPSTDQFPDGMRYYIGYVDMATGDVHIKPGSRVGDERPGHPEQNMYGRDASCQWVDGSGHDANRPSGMA